MSWSCPECGSNNKDDFLRCPCGYEIDIHAEELEKKYGAMPTADLISIYNSRDLPDARSVQIIESIISQRGEDESISKTRALIHKETNVKYENSLVRQIYDNFEKKPTEELLRIWQDNDRDQFSDDAFDVVKEILTARGCVLPIQMQSAKTQPDSSSFPITIQIGDEERHELSLDVSAMTGQGSILLDGKKLKPKKSFLSGSFEHHFTIGSQKVAVIYKPVPFQGTGPSRNLNKFVVYVDDVLIYGEESAILPKKETKNISRYRINEFLLAGFHGSKLAFFGAIFLLAVSMLINPSQLDPLIKTPGKYVQAFSFLCFLILPFSFGFAAGGYVRRSSENLIVETVLMALLHSILVGILSVIIWNYILEPLLALKYGQMNKQVSFLGAAVVPFGVLLGYMQSKEEKK